MERTTFWDEELRAFPHGGRGAAVWVVRREGHEASAPLKLLLAWESGQARRDGMAARPPLGSLLRAMADDREELIRRSRDAALWVEPLRREGQVAGCLAVWMDAAEPWSEGIFLWSQRLVPRLVPVLASLEPQGPVPGETLCQPTLFPLPPGDVPATGGRWRPGDGADTARSGEARRPYAPPRLLAVAAGGPTVALPRPVTVPGIPGCVGCSTEMLRLGQRLSGIARSGVNVLLHGESGTGKEIIAHALHVCSDRAAGPFLGLNCAALAECAISTIRVDWRLKGKCADDNLTPNRMNLLCRHRRGYKDYGGNPALVSRAHRTCVVVQGQPAARTPEHLQAAR